MLWMKTSAVLIRSRSAARPASSFRSSATERLLRLKATNIGPIVGECGALPEPRWRSPDGSSTLITSAPRSPMVWVA